MARPGWSPVVGSGWCGGAFNKAGDSLRTTKRNRYDPDSLLFIVGFRVARDLE
ncbi:MAG: hypothetical protein AB2813_15455 [Candidatus Sedimenticola endophacoides]